MYRILLIEDNIIFRETLKESILSIYPSVTICCSESCFSALNCIKVMLPDLIFIDIHLPDGNGLQLTKKIKKQYPDIHIIVLSLDDSPEYFDAALDNGANNFISKNSLSHEQLAKLLNPLVSRQNSSKTLP